MTILSPHYLWRQPIKKKNSPYICNLNTHTEEIDQQRKKRSKCSLLFDYYNGITRHNILFYSIWIVITIPPYIHGKYIKQLYNIIFDFRGEKFSSRTHACTRLSTSTFQSGYLETLFLQFQ